MLHLLVPGGHTGQAFVAAYIMLRSFCCRLDASLIIISHLKKNNKLRSGQGGNDKSGLGWHQCLDLQDPRIVNRNKCEGVLLDTKLEFDVGGGASESFSKEMPIFIEKCGS